MIKKNPVMKDPVSIKGGVKSPVLPKSRKDIATNPGLNPMTPGALEPGSFDDPFPVGSGGIPQWILDLEGGTINGNVLKGGEGGLPFHGGLGPGQQYANGLRDGWGADEHAPMPESLSSWFTPPGRGSMPTDSVSQNAFSASLGAAASRDVTINAAEHNLVKGAMHLSDKTIGSGGVDHNIAKTDIHTSQKAGLGPGIDNVGVSVARGMAHASVKSGGLSGMDGFGVDPVGLNIASSINSGAGTVGSIGKPPGIDSPRVDAFILGLAGSDSLKPVGTIGVTGVAKPLVDIGTGVNPIDRNFANPRATAFIDPPPVKKKHKFSNLGGFDIYGKRLPAPKIPSHPRFP